GSQSFDCGPFSFAVAAAEVADAPLPNCRSLAGGCPGRGCVPALPLARVARFPLGDLDRRACVAWRVEGAPRQCRKQPWCCPPGSCDASPYIVWSRRGSRCAASPRASGVADSAGTVVGVELL